jgi:putative transposase
VLLVTLAGWVNRHQQHVIEYLMEENRILKGQLEERRLRLTDDQRRRLAAKGRRLGRRVLRQVATIVTPDTILISPTPHSGTPGRNDVGTTPALA